MTEPYAVQIVCPFCATVHDYASSMDGTGPPIDGNVNICVRCERISIYDHDAPGGLRSPTIAEGVELMQQDDVRLMLWALNRANAVLNRQNN